MKLKEKFKNLVCDVKISNEKLIVKSEQIAEEFAIGFAEWVVLNYTEKVFYQENYTKELLEIYKKEKGL